MNAVTCFQTPHVNTLPFIQQPLNQSDLQLASQAVQIAHQLTQLSRIAQISDYGTLLQRCSILMEFHFKKLNHLTFHPKITEKLDTTKKLASLARVFFEMRDMCPTHAQIIDFISEAARLVVNQRLFIKELIYSDLIPISSAQKGLIPNGATREEAALWGKFIDDIAQDNVNILIVDSEHNFKHRVLSLLQILMGRKCGRDLLMALVQTGVNIFIGKGDIYECTLYENLKDGSLVIGITLDLESEPEMIVDCNSKKYFQHSLHSINLAHELVHAFLICSGQLVYDPPSDYVFSTANEELAITGEYGLLSCYFSENQFRKEFGLPPRYGHMVPARTDTHIPITMPDAVLLNLTGEIAKMLETAVLQKEELENIIRYCSQDVNRLEIANLFRAYGRKKGFF